MPFFVRIQNNEVTQCWDTQPPAGEFGWKPAIEVRPAITNRQYYSGHTFDITKDPVEIVYGVEDITVESRKIGLIDQAKSEFQQVVNEQLRIEMDDTDTAGDLDLVSASKVVKDARIAAINACTTHDELDAL